MKLSFPNVAGRKKEDLKLPPEKLIEKYRKVKRIDRAAIEELIDRVLIHERSVKWSHKGPDMEIFFRHGGRFLPPKASMSAG